MALLITPTAMSSRLPSLAALQRGRKDIPLNPENPYDTYSSWSSRSRMSMAFSSSPVRSSSPPRTPYSTRDADSYAYIHNSSPTLGYGLELPPLQRHSDDPTGWAFKQSIIPFKSAHRLNITETTYAQYDAYDLPPSSEMEVEDVVDDANLSLPEIDSETTSDSSPGHGSIYFSDSEEDLGLDEGDEDATFSFGYSTLRSTCFRVSSERGQWKDDPMALQPSATANLAARLRQSVPTPSRQASRNPSPPPSRPVSEPLPSTAEKSPLSAESAHDDSDGKEDEAPSSIPLSDRPITPEPQAVPDYSSPLPPSSPLLSPMSGCVSSMSRSVSPLSLPPSSPVMMPCDNTDTVEDESKDDEVVDMKDTATSLIDTLFPDDEDDVDMHVDVEVEIEIAAAVSSPADEALPPSGTPSRDHSPPLDSTAGPRKAISDTPTASTSHTEDVVPSHPSKTSHPSKPKASAPPVASGSSTRSGSPDENAAAAAAPAPVVKVKAKSKVAAEKQKARPREEGKPLQDQIDNSQLPSSSSSSSTSVTLPEPKKSKKQSKAWASEALGKRKADSLEEAVSDAPAVSKKRRQSSVAAEKVASSSLVKDAQPQLDEGESEDEDALPQPKASSKGKRKRAASSKPARASAKPKRASQLFAHESPQKKDGLDLVPEEIDAEMKGMIIECMATSRASSMPVSLVVRTVLQAHPRLKEQRAEKEWRKVVGRVLVNGMAGRGSGVFGKVDSSGKDDSDRPLEAQWFYVPEMDEDQDRAALIRSMMPRPGKRSVTKQYKQYYWRPLDKISRWDPDDAL